MSKVTVMEYIAALRHTDADAMLQAVYQTHLDSGLQEMNHFIGLNVEYEFETWPADLKQAQILLAQVHSDAMEPKDVEMFRARAESLMRPYRVTTGV